MKTIYQHFDYISFSFIVLITKGFAINVSSFKKENQSYNATISKHLNSFRASLALCIKKKKKKEKKESRHANLKSKIQYSRAPHYDSFGQLWTAYMMVVP